MQCHVEMTEQLIDSWCEAGAEEIAGSKASPGVQSAEQMKNGMQEKIVAMRRVADHLYDRWTKGLRK
jgi:hypothetical protein